MKPKVRSLKILLVILGFAILALHNSCTVAGFLMGTMVDSQENKNKLTSNSTPAFIKSGKKIIVHLKEGEEMRGNFIGYGKVPPDSISKLYSEYVNIYDPTRLLPAIGDSVEIFYKDPEMKLSGSYLAHDANDIYFRRLNDSSIFKCPQDTNYVCYTCRGKTINIMQLAATPGLDYISFYNYEGHNEKIMLYRAEAIFLDRKRNSGKIIGLAMGMAIDIVIITVATYYAFLATM